VTDTCAAAPCGAGTIAGTGSAAPTTWTVGGGLEYAISRNWSVKGEYLYVAAPSKNFVGVTGAGATDAFQARGGATNIARLGVNYRF
jgi:outer membrane immunogenic protein